MSRTWRALTLVACVALAASACNKGQGPSAAKGAKAEALARVNGQPVTLGYFEQRLEKMDRRFLPDTLDVAGKRKFLDFIINKELMAQKAEELKLGDDPRVVSTMQTYADNLAANAAIDQICKGKLDVTEPEIDQFFAKRQNKVLAKHVLVKSRAEAEEVRKQALAGTDFDTLATRYSIVPRQDVNTGEPLPVTQRVVFGEVQYGDAMPNVEDAVFGTKIGDVSQPVETSYGWHIFKPISTRALNLPPADAEARGRMKTQIQLRRKRALTEAYWDEIVKSHRYQIDDGAVALAFDKLPKDVEPEQRPDAKTEVKPVLVFTPQERDRKLFELDGKPHTIGEFSDRYDATNWFERPKRATGALGMKYWIRDRWMKPLQLERARKDGVYDLPEVADEVKMRREQMMVNMLHQNLIDTQAPEPTEAQIQEFYDKHKAVYVEQEKRRVNIIYNAQERVVQRAAAEIKGGAKFAEVAVRYDEGATKPEDVASPPFTADNKQFQEISAPAFALKNVGDSTEPFKTSSFWVMLQLAEVVPPRTLPLDEIRTSVIEDVKTQWDENKLNELLADWKKAAKIEVDEALLAKAEVRRTDVYVPGRVTPPPAGVKP
jgi:peptidyl-prolyl cis-trans isomerase C